MATPDFRICSVLLVLLFLANSGLSARVLFPETQDQSPSKSEPEFQYQTYSSAANGLQTDSGNTTEEGNLSQESIPSYLNSGDVNPSAPISSPSYASDASVLDKTDDESASSVSPAFSPVQDSPALETQKSNDLFQENSSLPPSPVYIGSPVPEITDGGSFSPENSAFWGNVNSPAFFPSYPASPPLESITDGGSFFDQVENQSNSPIANSLAPESNPEQEVSLEEPISSAPTPSNSEITQNPEIDNVYYDSRPESAVPAPETAFPFPETEREPITSDDLAPPTSYHEILPSNYRAEDEPVEPYKEKDESLGGNRAVMGILMGVCFVGVGGWVYKKRKNVVRAQYHSLAKKESV